MSEIKINNLINIIEKINKDNNSYIKIYPQTKIRDNEKVDKKVDKKLDSTYGSISSDETSFKKIMDDIEKYFNKKKNITENKTLKFRNLEKIINYDKEKNISNFLINQKIISITPLIYIIEKKIINDLQFPILNIYSDEFLSEIITFELNENTRINFIKEKKDNITYIIEIEFSISKTNDFTDLKKLLEFFKFKLN